MYRNTPKWTISWTEYQKYQLKLAWSEEPDWLPSIPAGINIPALSADRTKVHLSHFMAQRPLSSTPSSWKTPVLQLQEQIKNGFTHPISTAAPLTGNSSNSRAQSSSGCSYSSAGSLSGAEVEPRVIYLGKMEWERRKSRVQAPQNITVWPRGGIKV